MVSFNATLLVQILNFFVLLFLLDRLFFRKLAGLLAARRQFLSDAELHVQRHLTELAALQAEQQRQIDEARARAQAIIAKQLAAAEEEKARLLAVVRGELDAQRAQQSAELTAQLAAAEAQLRAEVSTLAAQIAERAAGTPPQPVLS